MITLSRKIITFLLMFFILWKHWEGVSAMQECGAVVNNTLKSPGYPEDYPNNLDCYYTVHIPPQMKVKYELKYFELEDSDHRGLCSYDYLHIVIKPKLKHSFDSKRCGKRTGETIELQAAETDRDTELTFHTDNKNTDKGFLITYFMLQIDPVNPVRQCGSLINNALKSPGYPDNYPSDMDCTYTVPIPHNMTMNITFIYFNLENHQSCLYDYLKITNDKQQIVGMYCGEKTGKEVFLTGDQLSITFHSDDVVEIGGFDLYFTAVLHVQPKIDSAVGPFSPGNEVSCSARGTLPIYTALIWESTVLVNTTDIATMHLYKEGNYTCKASSKYGTDKKVVLVEGCGPVINNTLTSPRYPENYPLNTDCTSSIPVPPGIMAINISFQEIYLENSSSCNRDYLEITNEQNQVFGKYCGNKTGQTVLVSGKYALIKFHSDDSLVERGFLMHFTFVPLNISSPTLHSSVPSITETGQPTHSSKETMIFILSGSLAFILLLVSSFVLGFLCYRRLHRKRKYRSSRSAREIIPFDKWELLPEQIEHKEELGRGAFGVVYKATLKRRVGIEVFDTEKTLKPEEPCQVVAVKVLQDDASEDQKQEFLQEIEQMKLLGSHQNVVSLVGCCTLQEHKFLVIEYVPFGDLLQWLRRRRRSINRSQADKVKGEETSYQDKATFNAQRDVSKTSQGNNKNFQDQENIGLLPMPSTSISQRNSNAAAILKSTENIDDDVDEEADSFTDQQLFSFAWQIAKGMNHLAEKDFIHRDLAARNILVGSDNRVKVSDFGLMRQIYEDVYSIKKTKKLPVKWMAPESIVDGIFTIKSDIWSFGILLWEMATMGGIPYPTMTNSELCRLLKTGYRMERPDMCSDEVYGVMCECWREDPLTRPSFSELIDRLEVNMTRDVPYCDLNRHDESRPYYNLPV